jgi:hypothetical protein
MAPVADEKGKTQPEQVDKHHQNYHARKEPRQVLPEQFFQRIPGKHGEGQVHGGNEQGAENIRRKELPMGPVVGREDT